MKKIVVFLGAPGSGKGTQAKMLSEKYGYEHISTGDLLRERANENELSAEERDFFEMMIKHGHLAPDKMIYSLAFKVIDHALLMGKGAVLDGAVRTVSQAQEFQKYFSSHNLVGDMIVVEVVIEDEESIKRLSSRRICKSCKSIMTIKKDDEKCKKCGGELIARADDNEETVKKRVAIQGNRAIEPIRNYYQSLNLWYKIDGMKSVEEVREQIENLIK